jgi:hypothetical protein
MDAVYTNRNDASDSGCEQSRECNFILPPCSVTNLSEAEVRAFFAEDLTDGEKYRLGLTMFIGVDQNEADVTVTQWRQGAWKTMLPVLYKTNNNPKSRGSTGDGRQFQ